MALQQDCFWCLLPVKGEAQCAVYSVPLLPSLCIPLRDADSQQRAIRVRGVDSVSCHYWLQTEWKCTYPGRTLHRNGSCPSFLCHLVLGLYKTSQAHMQCFLINAESNANCPALYNHGMWGKRSASCVQNSS